MSDEKKPGDSINATVGNVSDHSQVAVGHHIEQSQVHGAPPVMTEAEMVQLRQMFEELRTKIAQEAPPAEKDKALERVDELQEAVTAREPDLTTMEYVRNWFVKNLPSVAGSVVSLIVHPLVGKLVEVGGDAMATTFRKRFGIEKN
jgi:formate dehydrogenase maturation protein FdhE